MRNIAKLVRGFLLLILTLPMAQSFAFDKEKIDLMVDVMTAGCSLGMKVAVSVDAEGKISILKKGVDGSFKASKSEIPTVVDFLLDENLKGEQADKTRACMMKYMDMIFGEIAGSDGDEKPTEDVPAVTENGVVYKLNGCYRQGRNNIECKLTVVSSLIDRDAMYFMNHGAAKTTLFDNFGNSYFAASISVANHKSKTSYLRSVKLIADLPTQMAVRFENIGSNAESIALLSIHANTGQQGYEVRFRGLGIKEKAS